MSAIRMRQATLSDAAEMAPHMRRADADEVFASGGYSPQAALEDAILMSGGNAWTVRLDGEIMGIWGVVVKSVLTGEVIPWLLTSSVVDRHPKTFYKICKNAVWALRHMYDSMENRIDARHEMAIRWAKRLGFRVEPRPSAFGAFGAPFFKIELRGVEHV